MDANDLPLAARLACLIEAGRAANPDLKQGYGDMLTGNEACAMGLACLGGGANREDVANKNFPALQKATGLQQVAGGVLVNKIICMNDRGASLDEIILSLREGELAKVSA